MTTRLDLVEGALANAAPGMWAWTIDAGASDADVGWCVVNFNDDTIGLEMRQEDAILVTAAVNTVADLVAVARAAEAYLDAPGRDIQSEKHALRVALARLTSPA